MEQGDYIDKIWLISNKKWSGFSVNYGDNWFKIKSRGFENFYLVIFSLQFFQHLNNYNEDQDVSDLILIVFISVMFILLLYLSIFGKRTTNRIEYDYNRQVLTVSSRNLTRRIFKWSFDVKPQDIESISSIVFKNITRINITIAGKEHMLIDIRNRKGDGSETIDLKTDGEIIAECLENLLVVEEE